MKISGKTIKEYIWPIKYYILIAVLIVILQYYVAIPLRDNYGLFFILNLTQALWAIMVALSTIKLVLYHDFDFKNVLLLGVLYSFIIHGLKAFFFRVFLFPYSGTQMEILKKIIEKFLYGSFLVMLIVIIIGLVFIRLKKNKEVRDYFRWL